MQDENGPIWELCPTCQLAVINRRKHVLCMDCTRELFIIKALDEAEEQEYAQARRAQQHIA